MRYINTILIILLSSFIYSSVAIAKEKDISKEFLLSRPSFDIYIVEVNNIKLKDSNHDYPIARLNIVERIRGKINLMNIFNRGDKNFFNGYWNRANLPENKLELLNLERKKIIIFGVIATNTKEPTFMVYHHYPYSIKNREIVLNKAANVSILTGLIFGFLFIVLLLKIVNYFDTQVKKGYIREQFFKVLPYLLPLELLLYGYYHYETSKHYDIRIDLLFVIPAFFATIIFSALIQSRNSNKESISK